MKKTSNKDVKPSKNSVYQQLTRMHRCVTKNTKKWIVYQIMYKVPTYIQCFNDKKTHEITSDMTIDSFKFQNN